MPTTNIIIQWSDVNNDSISKYKFSYSKDNGDTWIETTAKSITPTKISPITVPFDTDELGLKSGEYLIKTAVFDGTLWSNYSESLSLRLSSFVANISQESDITDKSVSITFTVKSASNQQQIKITPIVNSSTGFKAELYKGITKLQTLNWLDGTQTKFFVFTPTANDEVYIIKITANVPLGAGYNNIITTLSLVKDTNNINFATVNVSRNNPIYNNLSPNYLFLERYEGVDYLKSQYPITSDLTVELTNKITSNSVAIYMMTGTNSIEIDYDVDGYLISAIEPEEDGTYTYHFN